MDAVDADMDDLFGADEAIEDNRYNDDFTSSNVNSSKENDDNPRKVAVKKITRNPQPKLDAERLISEKGIPKLLKSFQNVEFKGKGHETEDLDKMMAIVEHWGHCMFPQFTFTDLVEKIEKLGSKRPVHVCMEKIRRDMPVCDGDFFNNEDENNVQREGDFDQLLAQDSASNMPSSPSSQIEPNVSQTTNAVVLTDEQIERIARNKKMAEERRLARLNAAANQENVQPGACNDADSPIAPMPFEKSDEKTEEELMAMLDDENLTENSLNHI